MARQQTANAHLLQEKKNIKTKTLQENKALLEIRGLKFKQKVKLKFVAKLPNDSLDLRMESNGWSRLDAKLKQLVRPADLWQCIRFSLYKTRRN